MPNIKRSSKQAAKDRAALKRLRNSGKYKGKIDLRKPPTKYQLTKIKSLRGKRVAKSKARKSRRPPATKTPGMRAKRSELTAKQVRNLKEPSHKLTTYALPFLRKGQDEPEWRRFTYKQLRQFIAEYKADDPEAGAEWMSYAVKEHWTFDTLAQVSEMRKETNVYFSGVRIDEPNGKIRKRVKRKKRTKKSR